METELHWPEMKASEDLDFHCTSIFKHGLFLHQPFHQLHMVSAAPRRRNTAAVKPQDPTTASGCHGYTTNTHHTSRFEPKSASAPTIPLMESGERRSRFPTCLLVCVHE